MLIMILLRQIFSSYFKVYTKFYLLIFPACVKISYRDLIESLLPKYTSAKERA